MSVRLSCDGAQGHGPPLAAAEDAALMLDAVTGLDPLWPLSITPPWESALSEVRRVSDARDRRIAYGSDLAGIGVEEEIGRICRAAALRLQEDGAYVTEIQFDVSEGRDAYQTLRRVDGGTTIFLFPRFPPLQAFGRWPPLHAPPYPSRPTSETLHNNGNRWS